MGARPAELGDSKRAAKYHAKHQTNRKTKPTPCKKSEDPESQTKPCKETSKRKEEKETSKSMP
jgi:hypothetical protein